MVQIGFKSNKGIIRKNNEDACFVIPGSDVYIVADGVGGNNSGEVASRTAVENNVTVFTALETVRVLLDVLEEITLGISTIDEEYRK